MLRTLGRTAAAAGLAALAVLSARRLGRPAAAPPCARPGGCAGCPAAGTCSLIEPPRRPEIRQG
jgi:hypothetical protein